VAKKTAGSGPPILVDETPVTEPAGYPARTRDKVAIVGFAEGHRHLAPYGDDSWEIWGLNRLHAVQQGRWTRWFEVHGLAKYYEGDPQHREWMRTCGIPIYLRPQDVGLYDIPSGEPYPVERVLSDFGRYMTNSVAWMIAMGVGMGFAEMGLWGVDMAQDAVFPTNEYRQQRPSCEYLLGVAVGRGMRIHLPPGSDLLKASHLYGLEDGDAILGKRMSRMEELNRRKGTIREQIAQLEQQKAASEKQYLDQKIALVSAINQLDGALQEAIYEQVNLSPPPEFPLEKPEMPMTVAVKG
jgi:hypothetical protein